MTVPIDPAERVLRWFFVVLALIALGPLDSTAATEPQAASDVILVLDNSGSMKKIDPGSLMRQIVAEFADRLAPKSRLGLVVFDGDVEIALPLTSRSADDFTASVTQALAKLDYSGQRTDIAAGIERAIYGLRQQPREGVDSAIIFLTDGIVDVGNEGRNIESSRWLRDELANQAKDLEIRIFGIALTDAADFQLIQSVSHTTGGAYFVVDSTDAIGPAFEQISARIGEIAKKPEPIEAIVADEVVERVIERVVEKVIEDVPAPIEQSDNTAWLVTGVAVVSLAIISLFAIRRRQSPSDAIRLPDAVLREVGSEDSFRLVTAVTTIGREPSLNDMVLSHETVSSRHAIVEYRNSTFYLRDEKSGNGTYLEGRRMDEGEELLLRHGNRIRFDAYEYEFLRLDVEAPGKTAEVGASAGRTMLRVPPVVSPVAPSDSAAKVLDNSEAKAPAEAPSAPPVVTPPEKVVDSETTWIHEPPDLDSEATLTKPRSCPNHSTWKATEVCTACGKAFCTNCMTGLDAKRRCTGCAK